MHWGFPAIPVTAATMLGLASANLEGKGHRRPWFERVWRVALLLLLAAAAILALTRYYASTAVTWARLALADGETVRAQRDLTWALRLNPLSFPAHQWMARARLRSGDPRGALEIAERAVRIAPSDPDGHYLEGEAALAVGDWEVAQARFRRAVDQAPFAQLRYHAGLVEAAVRAGRGADARPWYDQARAIFSPERVLGSDARCLAPGDRYLLARMSRIVALVDAEAGNPSRQQAAMDAARLLAQPDDRGICVTRGRPGQTSPEKAAESFWRALAEGGRPLAAQFLVPERRPLQPGEGSDGWGMRGRPLRADVAWIASMSRGEQQVSLRIELEIKIPDDLPITRCAQMDFRLILGNWFVDGLPVLEPLPCGP
jgi:tetratricopeptide (TPR) repeat protein